MAHKKKNPHAVALGRLGGLVSSPAKKRAAKENILKRWARVRALQEGHKERDNE